MNKAMSVVALALALAAGPLAWARGAGGSGGSSSGPSGAPDSSPGGAPGSGPMGAGSPTDTTGSSTKTGAGGTGVSPDPASGTSVPSTRSGAGVPAAGSVPTPSASPASGEFTGRHTMTGEVTKIDAKTGKFSLKTAEGTLDLHAPPSALSGVKQGDRMSVEIAVKPMK